jgi:hypothetical protein
MRVAGITTQNAHRNARKAVPEEGQGSEKFMKSLKKEISVSFGRAGSYLSTRSEYNCTSSSLRYSYVHDTNPHYTDVHDSNVENLHCPTVPIVAPSSFAN